MLLGDLQEGESPGLPHSRPMPGIGPRCHELRVNDGNKTWRADLPPRSGRRCDSGCVPKENRKNAAGSDSKLPTAAETLRSKPAMKKLRDGWVEGSVQD